MIYDYTAVVYNIVMEEENLTALRTINNNTYIQIEHEIDQPPPNPKTPETTKSETHVHSDQCKHGDGRGRHQGHGHGRPGQKNYAIIIYTIFTCLSCLYLETQYLNPLLNDYKSRLMSCVTYFDVFMCLWSYFQTMRISSKVEKLQERQVKPYRLDYLKRCDKCNYWKGPRVSHCSSCGGCIYKLDHHCMWTQTCIGHCNQRPFYLFCFYMTVGVMQFWYSTIRVAHTLISNCQFFAVFEPGVYILWGITCISAGLVGIMIVALCVGHSFFVATNFTTLDGMKTKKTCFYPFLQCRRPYLSPDAINPWDRGEIQNLKQLFGTNLLTFWMPLGREIKNEHIFQAMSPEVQPLPEQRKVVPSGEASGQLGGRRVRVGDGVVQL